MAPPRRYSLVLAAALCSGAATLVYEVVWVRVLAISVGATWPALTVVLAGMMLGLGLGAVIGGRLVERGVPALRTTAIIELLVLVVAAAFPWVALWIGNLELAAVGVVPGRALLAGAAMLPATTLMGTTMPLMSVALHQGDAGATHLPRLYAANTLGACLGAMAGGLVLPYLIGVQLSLVLAGALNLLAAGLAWRAAGVELSQAPVVDVVPTELQGHHGPLLALAFGSGAVVMLAELFWTRSMLQMPGQAFEGMAVEHADVLSLVLVFVLLGSGLGALGAARTDRWTSPQLARLLAATWGLGGLLSLVGIEGIALKLGGHLLLGPWAPVHIAVRILLVAVPATLLGLSFPLLARLLSGALEGHGRRLGRAWLVNTAGAVTASIVGGWLLLPAVGAASGMVLTATLCVILAVTAARMGGRSGLGWALGGALALGATLLWVPREPGQTLRRLEHFDVVAHWEGWEATTMVARRPDGDLAIATNGRWIPGNVNYRNGGMDTVDRMQKLTQHPVRHVLLVGFGTGLFAAGMLDGLKQGSLTIVELDGGQLRGAAHFGTQGVLTDPRVTVVVDDALHFLDRTDQIFDLVAVDSWGPEASPALFSRQFHERVAQHLSPNGALWAKVPGLDDSSMAAVQDAARAVYPYTAVEVSDHGPTALMGTQTALTARHDLQPLPACAGDCSPLDLMWPRRLRRKPMAKGRPPGR